MERDGILSLLIHDTGEFWSLPEHRMGEPGAVNSWIRDRYGVEAGTLDVMRISPETSAPPAYLFAHETHETHETRETPRAARADTHLPPGARWAPVTELTDDRRALPGHRRLLRLWLDGRRAAGDAWLPWQRPGWFTMATAWAERELRGLGIETVGPARQNGFRAWSCQLLLPTTAGLVHLKASPPPHAHEPALTRLLSEWFPGSVPSVLAVDTRRRLMLTADFGPVHRPEGTARIVSYFERVARQVALLQRESADRAAEITATGCPAHPLDRLPELFDDLISQASSAGRDEPTPEESARLRRLLPGFARACARLALLGLPNSLVHHDLWRGNVRDDGDQVLLFDWADSVLTHPFLQLDVLLKDLADALGSAEASAEAREQVRDSYLAAWAGHRPPPEQLRTAAALAAAIAPVSRALLMRDRLAAAPAHLRSRYRGAIAAPLRTCLPPPEREPGDRDTTPEREPVGRGTTPEPATRRT